MPGLLMWYIDNPIAGMKAFLVIGLVISISFIVWQVVWGLILPMIRHNREYRRIKEKERVVRWENLTYKEQLFLVRTRCHWY